MEPSIRFVLVTTDNLTTLRKLAATFAQKGVEVWFTDKNGDETAGTPEALISKWDATYRNNDRPDYEPEDI